jgi:hypothetical protein
VAAAQAIIGSFQSITGGRGNAAMIFWQTHDGAIGETP